MTSFNELTRRSVLPLAGLALAAYYLLVFLPLARRADSVDQPLKDAWRKLAASLDQTNATALDFAQITNQLNNTRQQLALLEAAKKKTAAHLALAPALRSQLLAGFQLVDYQNERSKRIDQLDAEAKKQKLVIDPVVYAGFPEYTADMQEHDSPVLWAALSFTTDVLHSAIQSKVAALHALEVAVALTNSVSAETSARWAEVALQLEFTAAADNALRVLQSLPLTAEEIRGAGLPPAAPDKAPLFIDRLIVRKETPERLDEVRVWFRATGFVPRE